jgi:hypothetical protein
MGTLETTDALKRSMPGIARTMEEKPVHSIDMNLWQGSLAIFVKTIPIQ